jgi:heme A synthase
MAKLTGLPVLLTLLSLVCFSILAVVWLTAALIQRRRKDVPTALVQRARWLTVATFLLNLVMLVLVSATFGDNMFQMLFGLSPQVRSLLLVNALVMGILALVMGVLAVQLHRRKEGKRIDRSVLASMAVLIVIYAGSMAALAS